MKNLAKILVTLLLVSSLASAQESGKTLHYKFQIMRASKAATKRYYSQTDWEKAVNNGRFEVLEEITMSGKIDRAHLVFVGRKVPIGYKDPRAAGYQVQYTDSGFKVDLTTRDLGSGEYKVEIRPERGTLVLDNGIWGTTNVMLTETVVNMKQQQVAILASWRGVWVPQYVKSTYPKANISENDTVFIAITLN